MSEQNNETKVYAPMSVKQFTFQSGKSILKLGINVAKFKAWLDQHANEKGYVNMGISERKSVSQYGESHTAWLDTWRPDASNRADAPQPRPTDQTQTDSSGVPF